jgi:hypothetical protein
MATRQRPRRNGAGTNELGLPEDIGPIAAPWPGYPRDSEAEILRAVRVLATCAVCDAIEHVRAYELEHRRREVIVKRATRLLERMRKAGWR